MKLFEVRIIQNRPIAKNQWALTVKTENENLPDFLPGQFCMLSLPDLIDPFCARPFAIVEKKEGMYQFIYRVVGKFTQLLVKAPQGSRLVLTGPLGKGIPRDNFKKGRFVFVAGGVGYASLLPLISNLTESGQAVDSHKLFYGVREELEVIRRLTIPYEIASDDGSIGFKGRLSSLLSEKSAELSTATAIYVCGPTPMMKSLYEILPLDRTSYFVEAAMGCGTGLCLSCVLPITHIQGFTEPIRSCIEGPIFKAPALKFFKEAS